MCEPTTIVALTMMAVSAYGAKVKGDQANDMAVATAENAHAAASFNYDQLSAERDEVDEKAAQDKFQRQLQTQREHGTISVAAGEAGVGGTSVMKVMSNAVMQGSYDTSVIEANRMSKARQIVAKKFSVHAAAQGATNVAESQIQSPTTQAINVGVAGAQGYMSGKALGKSMFGGKTIPTDVKNVNVGSQDAYTSNMGIR